MLMRRRPVWSDGASGVEDVKSGVVSAVQVARNDVRHDEVALPNNKDKCMGDADSVVVLIGERPGLSAPDSMGAYLTWQPGPQTTDAQRNCISNIRPEGIGYADAAFRLMHLLMAMRARRISGVALKDTTERLLAD
jgi:ethanolamine ammonia-lyase small subunit